MGKEKGGRGQHFLCASWMREQYDFLRLSLTLGLPKLRVFLSLKAALIPAPVFRTAFFKSKTARLVLLGTSASCTLCEVHFNDSP